ncbi:Isoeugenol synthase 1, partial [Sarracenia purpurea var. burkii]
KRVQGELDDHEKLVSVLREVDVVISALAVPQHLEQLKIITAMKEAGNIKRFVPSEFGNEVDRVSGLPPFQALLDNKKKIRRATEAAGIPYTYVSANSFDAYFVDFLLHPDEMLHQVTIYGNGQAKGKLLSIFIYL